MKKSKIALETSFWAGNEAKNAFKAIHFFFAFAHLDYYKQNVSEMLMYSYKTKVYKQDNPSDVFILYKVIKSFFKVGFCLKEKSRKWKVKEPSQNETVFQLSSLTKEEYENPFIVFQKAFEEKTLEEFELFLGLILEHSLSPIDGYPESDVTTPYIHLIKMLDAAELIKERGVEKIKKTHRIDAATE
ncbi:hypothetical protein [Flavobacterium quisquiliarum]|uniref:HEPN domain-containing protein n=1 Tax=Flavobacterium quisquiliarum TaxID=1834436 RepID=A0ABV8W3Q7_9FLAO|nr:hypothetical protein [Flavobacterium quisquiliarum]MBW1654577.1 hypothetical protein [Flavobacterium quisquiliarum]NWL01738.1 hypothetical protein [Flavobacterium collinsii]